MAECCRSGTDYSNYEENAVIISLHDIGMQADDTTTTASPLKTDASMMIYPRHWPCWWWDTLPELTADPNSDMTDAVPKHRPWWPCWWGIGPVIINPKPGPVPVLIMLALFTLFIILSTIEFSSIQTDDTTTTKATPIAIKASNSLFFPPWHWPVLQDTADTAAGAAAKPAPAQSALLRWPCWWWPKPPIPIPVPIPDPGPDPPIIHPEPMIPISDQNSKLIMTLICFCLLYCAIAFSAQARMLPMPYSITYPPWHPWNCWWDYGVGPIMFERDSSPTDSSSISVDSTVYRPWDWPCWGGIIDDPLPSVDQVATPPSPVAVPASSPTPVPAPPVVAKPPVNATAS
ncbi:hypothetical protein PRIPAC_92344 [Pristionchus pacificus]|uniref:Uncharacterized protein n=1 Tax=Pristionchus pacificus TaxID=54126 RepID=A0A2A6BAS9_PRIPA|nr:hypothetical protein PRIPAC_92344 [Pristionchus pacificus]|eukprot:PDM62999.1 hypothetical protein PRIPAC_50214 [Pristionchus pacificus]